MRFVISEYHNNKKPDVKENYKNGHNARWNLIKEYIPSDGALVLGGIIAVGLSYLIYSIRK